MDTKLMNTFLVLARTLNYQSAARQLQYAPSTLLRQIRQLEAELGAELLEKKGKSLNLTTAGTAFIPYAEKMTEDMQKALSAIAAAASPNAQIEMGGCEMITQNDLFDLISGFTLSHPQVHLYSVMSSNANAAVYARKGMTDIAFYYTMDEAPVSGLHTRFLFQEPLHWMAPEGHPLLERSGVTYQDFDGMVMSFPHSDCCFILEALHRLRRKGVNTDRAVFLGGIPVVVDYARKNNGLMLVPHNAAIRFVEREGMRYLDMAEEPIWIWDVLVYRDREQLGHAAQLLLDYSTRYARRLCRQDDGRCYRSPAHADR